MDEHKPVEDAAAAEDVALVVAARRHDMMIAKISPLLPLLPPPRRVFYAVVSTIYIQFFCGDKIMDTKKLEEVFWRAFFIYGTLRKRAHSILHADAFFRVVLFVGFSRCG